LLFYIFAEMIFYRFIHIKNPINVILCYSYSINFASLIIFFPPVLFAFFLNNDILNQ